MFYVYYMSTLTNKIITLEYKYLRNAQELFDKITKTQYETVILACDTNILLIK